MKLVTFIPTNHWQSRIGAIDTDSNQIIDLNAAYAYYLHDCENKGEISLQLADVLVPSNMTEFISRGNEGLNNAKLAVNHVLNSVRVNEEIYFENRRIFYELSGVKLKTPVPNPPGIGIGYFSVKGIIEEASRVGDDSAGIKMALEYPKEATISWGHPSTVIGHEENIVFPSISKQLFNSIELGIIVGKFAHRVPREKAHEYIYGYTVTTDITAFDLVQNDNFVYTVCRSKDMPTFWPVGPWIVTADEIKDPMNLNVEVRQNGENVIKTNTNVYDFTPADYICDVSKYMDLEPGTIIAMGAFVGTTTDAFIKVGDVVENEIEGIGILKNFVVAENDK